MTEKSDSLFNKQVSRRSVILGAAAIAGGLGMAGLLPEYLAKAASAPAPSGGFDLSKVKHVVYLMQENRSFDHYFGTFPGARGFKDPTAMTLANGNSVFQQPDPANPDGYLEPYHMDTASTGAAAVPSLSHDWRDQHAAFNKGAMDGWLTTHIASDGDVKGSFTMGYMEQQDIPFHWALAEKFTLCDNYHCSVMGPTYPNRAVWMSGTNDPTGAQGGPILETVKPNVLQWKSAAEVLYKAGYTVKTYTSSGSYNYFSWWKSFATTGQVDTALYNRIMQNGTLFGDGKGGIGNPASPTAASTSYLGFEEDCANGTLADVTWLFPDGPYASDEHPPNTPAAGAYFLASKLEALAANEDLWNSTVFIINYDENDGFFDHVPPPVPDPVKYPDEYVKVPSPRGTPGGGLPSGSGFRVPCFIISPWTVGGHIYSQVADHTSPLQLIEAITAAGGLNGTPSTQAGGRTAVTFSAISPWRRTTFDDFSGAFQDSALPAPTDAEFVQDARQANYLAQRSASAQPMPPRPGAAQSFPN
jgi:phospholipase C